MISQDFEYYRPTSLIEAIQLFKDLDFQNKSSVYYAGGTEIISMARMNQISPKALIDIKEIPECNVLVEDDNKILIGAAVTLTRIREANLFPLLSDVLRNSSDHTSRNKITIGGNICGKIPYREGILPFLICDSQIEIAGPYGNRVANISDIFDKELTLEKGELLVRIITDKEYINLPYETARRTKQGKVDYPLISIVAIKKNSKIRLAFSGLCVYPFRERKMEDYLNRNMLDENSTDKLLSMIPDVVLSDIRGSAEYREFLFKNMMKEILERMGARQCFRL